MKCTICRRDKSRVARVTYHFINPDDSWMSDYCVYWNDESNRWQILHKGVIAATRNMADGNIKWVDIQKIGY